MPTWLFTHRACLEHVGRPESPEKPDRLAAVLERLEAPEFAGLRRQEAPLATRQQICRVHEPQYASAALDRLPESGLVSLSPDTSLCPRSGEAALRAAGAVCAAVDAVVGGQAPNAFCAVRPPGHHAAQNTTMGFCVFNNAAVGAEHARATHGLKRIAILDFDVHHGNGTQAIYRRDPDVLFASVHQAFIFPRTGDAGERGVGNLVNVPVVRDSKADAYFAALGDQILPAIEDFKPELLILSSGFDAHIADPLADLKLRNEDFGTLTRQILAVAERACDGRVVSVLEGGYAPKALAAASAHHVLALMDAARAYEGQKSLTAALGI